MSKETRQQRRAREFQFRTLRQENGQMFNLTPDDIQAVNRYAQWLSTAFHAIVKPKPSDFDAWLAQQELDHSARQVAHLAQQLEGVSLANIAVPLSLLQAALAVTGSLIGTLDILPEHVLAQLECPVDREVLGALHEKLQAIGEANRRYKGPAA